jgi:cleavage and polyadenylation specificity factor subunit 4
MQEIVASVDHLTFSIDKMLEQQIGAQALAFPGMDKSGSAICTFFLTSTCSKGSSCPFRHIKGERAVVCKHWLRGLCKKGDDCEFLHEFDMSKMPECYFFSRFGECGNKECPFLHIDPEKKIKVCPWYDRGFCRHGALCKNRHVRRVLCVNYLCGFCLDGPTCKFVHPKFDLPVLDSLSQTRGKMTFTCHRCNEVGHKAVSCPRLGGSINSVGDNLAVTVPVSQQSITRSYLPGLKHDLRPLDQVTCFKCGDKGHYANRCPKGHLAFLSSSAHHIQNQMHHQIHNHQTSTNSQLPSTQQADFPTAHQ